NEFGHPDWIDFPREQNDWSYRYARRQWSLVADGNLKYQYLGRFDKDMVALVKKRGVLGEPPPRLLYENNGDNVMAFERNGLVFVFNFHPSVSHTDYRIAAPAGQYRAVFDSDAAMYGGHNRLTPDQVHFTMKNPEGGHFLQLYLPTRTAIVLQPQ
ncbi:MAG: alpha amylase C-terminal domain-containing protein, partial [Thermodesulfobacteriota bacterium]